MNRREAFGRIAGMTAAAAALARLKMPRKAEPQDYGFTQITYEGASIQPALHTVSTQVCPTTMYGVCGKCGGTARAYTHGGAEYRCPTCGGLSKWL